MESNFKEETGEESYMSEIKFEKFGRKVPEGKEKFNEEAPRGYLKKNGVKEGSLIHEAHLNKA